MLVPRLVRVTVAPGITAPLTSLIVPASTPSFVDWADASEPRTTIANRAAHARNRVMRMGASRRLHTKHRLISSCFVLRPCSPVREKCQGVWPQSNVAQTAFGLANRNRENVASFG